MGVGAGLYMYDVVVKTRSRSLSHLLMSSCQLKILSLTYSKAVRLKTAGDHKRPQGNFKIY